jgi:hypothetical protein
MNSRHVLKSAGLVMLLLAVNVSGGCGRSPQGNSWSPGDQAANGGTIESSGTGSTGGGSNKGGGGTGTVPVSSSTSSHTGSCIGTAAPCIYYRTDYSWECERQAGCSLTGIGDCVGPPWPCSEIRDDEICFNQKGCSWYPPSCIGTVAPCNQRSETTCYKNPGCSNSAACEGTALPCTQLWAAICSYNPGCSLSLK